MTLEAWKLALSGDFEGALQIATTEIAESPLYAPLWMNKGIILLNLGRPVDAAAAFEHAVKISADVSNYHVFLGVADWLAGDHDSAMMSWKTATKCAYSDAAGGVDPLCLLYYSAVARGSHRARIAALDRMRAFWKPRLLRVWPGPILGYLAGELSEETFLQTQTFANPALEERRLCRAHFWVAVKAMTDHVDRKTKSELMLSQQRPVMLEFEYYLSKRDLELLVNQDH